MKTHPLSGPLAIVSVSLVLGTAPLSAQQGGNANSTVTGGNVTGGTVKGGTVTGGSTTGSSVTGGTVTGGSVTGGSVTGGTVTGGTVTGGTVRGATVTAGTATGGTTVQGNVVSPGTATVTVGGREVTARTSGAVSISTSGPNANVTLGNHTLIVQREMLIVDGKQQGKIPAGTSKVSIQVENGQLSVSADGQAALSVRLEQPR